MKESLQHLLDLLALVLQRFQEVQQLLLVQPQAVRLLEVARSQRLDS